MTELDIFNQLHYAKEDGFAEGKSEGLAEGELRGHAKGKEEDEKLAKIETAKNMLKESLSIELICKITGLSKKDIQNISL